MFSSTMGRILDYLLGVLSVLSPIAGQYVLTPPYFNIAENRPITANATCGEGVGLGRETFCKLVGGYDRIDETFRADSEILDGQVCDICLPLSKAGEDGIDLTKIHGPKNAVDGDISTWWQSPPISRGRKYNRVDLEIDLLQRFQVAYVVMTMADSPRPGVWSLEKSMDNGKTWTPWQYFASNDVECQKFFGIHANQRIVEDDTVVCATEFSKILPIEGGEIFVPLTKGRPSEDNIQTSETMLKWLEATNIRIKLMQTKTMLGDLMSVAQGDSTVTRRYYYAIKEISIGGRCVCNGHAYICPPMEDNNSKLKCECEHHTRGLNCEECEDGFTQKKWRRYTAEDRFECEPCNCHGHSSSCHYNQTVDELGLSLDIHSNYEGGGVCESCQHFTTGINCHQCIDGYFRPPDRMPNHTEPCIPCDCPDPRHSGNCRPEDGLCECKEAFRGAEDCSACAQGYYDYPDCKQCPCYPEGTLLDQAGLPICVTEGEEGSDLQCPCKENYDGTFCDECAPGYYNFPDCIPCECNSDNSESDVCDPVTGQCLCKPQFGGRACDECNDGHYLYPTCATCNCDVSGATDEICTKSVGDCLCKEGYGGERCDRCKDGWFGYPDCEECLCSEVGITGSEGRCDQSSGQCPCRGNFAGRQCDSCTAGYYDYPNCFSCGCDSVGSTRQSCGDSGVCDCKENFVGEKCDQCAPERFNYPLCEECNCNPDGVTENFFAMGGCANVPKGELCDCKEAVTGRTCDTCKPLFWNLRASNPQGCEDCNCNRNGTIGRIGLCDQLDGECGCKAAVMAGKCTECSEGWWGMDANSLLGCQDCQCDLGGSEHYPGQDPVCHKESGQCTCKVGMMGRQCNEVEDLYYLPNLYQHQLEIEDGYRMDGSPVRFDFKQSRFPGFSWRGYAGFSPLQDEVLHDVSISRASTYNAVLRFQNPNPEAVQGEVSIYRPGRPEEAPMTHSVVLEPTGGQPALVTVSGDLGLFPSPFDLENDTYTVKVNIDNKEADSQELLVDYLVLLPNEYVKPRILRKNIQQPCRRRDDSEYCREYAFPVIQSFPAGLGKDAMRPGSVTKGEIYDFIGDQADLDHFNLDKVVEIASWQPEVNFDIGHGDGKHVAVLSYFTGLEKPIEGTNMFVTIKDNSGNVLGEGEAFMYDCPYTELCRQVVTDSEGRILEFDLVAPNSMVNIKEKTGENIISVERVVLIPLELWSPEFVTPNSRCVKGLTGDCITPRLPYPPMPDDSVMSIPKQILDGYPARNLPKGINDQEKQLVYINRDNPMVDVTGRVPKEGVYVVIAEYYQPNHPEVLLTVNVTNKMASATDSATDEAVLRTVPVYEAVLPLPNCASNIGCRTPVMAENMPADFRITEEFDITFVNDGPEGAWIEYIYTMPSENFYENPEDLLNADLSVDELVRFEEECGKDNFYMRDDMDEGFCKASVISISSEFNAGALPCECDPDGSEDLYQCSSLGGQCQCKDHVIGRSCTRCEPEYFGFPECKQCSCPPTATCNEDTGDCICAPFVTGSQDNPCSECEENTFGYDPITGCQECNCMANGTVAGNMSCSMDSGHCYCKENVEGRKCDHCSYGSYAYPDCESCDCDLRGTKERICDQETAECFCKQNVVQGSRCDTCSEGHFNLQETNPDGCMECFCFGKSGVCSSNLNMQKSKITDMESWTGVTFRFENRELTKTDINLPPLTNLNGLLDLSFDNERFNDIDLSAETFYFQSGSSYSGSHIASYGGVISYKITYSGYTELDTRKTPDVILESRTKERIMFYAGQKVSEYNYESQLTAILEPRYWVTDTGNPVHRDKMMVILNSLEHLYIKGSYGSSQSSFSRLSSVAMDSAVEEGSEAEDPALSVEICQCPEGYTGGSCQLCSPGYFSNRSDKWGPICEKCNCNGHANTCHPQTGKCVRLIIEASTSSQTVDPNFCHYNPEQCSESREEHCDDHTTGEHCESCAEGYFGDATTGKSDACQSCPCPLPDNNFAISCDMPASPPSVGRVCQCQPNYVGERCESCGPGYYGEPETPGSSCQPCQCNGNIDTSHPSSCDSVTGLCLMCLHNTTGDSCERCEPWFFGDAITLKNCRPCDCDLDGTEECDHLTGQCRCLPGVEGERCDQCQANHWGFDQHGPDGCLPCECTEASQYSQCDLQTGQCTCKPGVTGQKCERCLNGFWNLGPNGCERCGCNTEFAIGGGCDPLTGQCVCLPRVTGQNCDGCPPNHYLIMNETRAIKPQWKYPFDYEEGCFPCSSCVEDLMNNMNNILKELNPVLDEFLKNEASFYANQKLNWLNDQINQLKPAILRLQPAVGNKQMMPLEQSMDKLNRESKSLNILYKLERMSDLGSKAEILEADGLNAVQEMGEAWVKIKKVIADVREISAVLGSGVDKELLKTSIQTAEQYLSQMQTHDFSTTRVEAEEELQAARGVMDEVKEWAAPVDRFKQEVVDTKERMDELENKIADLQNQTETARGLSGEAGNINFRNEGNKDLTKYRKIDEINSKKEVISATQQMSSEFITAAEGALGGADTAYSGLRDSSAQMAAKIEEFQDRISSYQTEMDALFELERKASEKARNLEDQAINLVYISESASGPAENAIKAANAFKNILDFITAAETDATKAGLDATTAADMSRGVKEKARGALERIKALYQGEQGAVAAREQVRGELSPWLDQSTSAVDNLEQKHKEIKENLESINDNLDKMSDLSSAIKESKKNAKDSLKDGEDALASINARATEISNQKKIAYDVRNANSEYQLAVTNIKKSLNEYEAKPDRSKRDAFDENDIPQRLQHLTDKQVNIDRLADLNGGLLSSIRDTLKKARGALQGMNKPAVSFNRGSTLELTNPDNLQDLGTKTDVSLYVKGVGLGEDGAEDNDARAFLFYMGHLVGTMKKIPQLLTDDYMALQVLKDGRVSLSMDVGSGPLTIDSSEPLRSGDWHQVVVSREGREVTMTVRSEAGPDEITEDVTTGSFPLLDSDGKPFLSGSVFNLHPDFTKIYVGGFPTDSTPVQDSVRSTDMKGTIEGLVIGDTEVGLWNYKDSKLISGSNTRTKFLPKPKSELRFDGNGYVKLDPAQYYLEQQQNTIQFRFRAQEPNGLMFLAGSSENGFISISLRDNYVVFSYKIGSDGELVEVSSDSPVLLDTWYLVKAERDGAGGMLYIDGVQVGLGRSQSFTGLVISSITDLYMGGYPGSDYEDIESGFFTGCIKEGNIAVDKIDITNVTRVNVESECSREVLNTLSFMAGSPGYVQLEEAEVNGSLTVSFSFRTGESSGLMLYMREITGNHYVSLSLSDGALHLYAFPYLKMPVINPETRENVLFNDNKWHSVSVTIIDTPRKLVILQIDDFWELNSGEVQEIPLLVNTKYETFFGGLSSSTIQDIPSGSFENGAPYVGCIRDALVMNDYIDFQESVEISGASLGECGVVSSTEKPPTVLEEEQESQDKVEDPYDPVDLFPEMNYERSPEVHGQCGLPVSPALDPDLNIDSGFRFGVKDGSFLEYVRKGLPDMMVDKSRFQVDFKTTHPDGLIFFMMNEEGKKDFVALFIKNHKLVYSFNCGSGASYLETDFKVTDGNWHSVEFSRTGRQGKLVFDSIEVKVPDHAQSSGGSTTKLEVKPHIYLGGLDETMRTEDNIRRELQLNSRPIIPGFVGCLRNLKYEQSKNGKTRMKALGTRWAKNNLVVPCSDKVESGYFFGPRGGRIRAERRFLVGLDFDITMMIKPRNLTGVLAAIKGKRDYLLLRMLDGAIEFTVDNGRGPIRATFRPSNPFEFCNGKWHEIHAVKAKNVVTLSVNKIFAQPGIGVPGVSSTDTNNPLFLGTHPRPGRFNLDPREVNYVGCMKDVVIERKPYFFTNDQIYGDISAHVCPTI